MKQKYPHVAKAIISSQYKDFPIHRTFIRLGKEPLHRRYHEIYYQQGSHYGSVGDQCDYVSHEELFELARKGVVNLYSPGGKLIMNLKPLTE